MSEPEVFINEQKVGEWKYGYAYFYFDITNYVKDSDNTIAVKLNNREQSSRWYPGAGLYRNVSIIVKNKESIDQWGVFVTTPYVTKESTKVNIKCFYFNMDYNYCFSFALRAAMSTFLW